MNDDNWCPSGYTIDCAGICSYNTNFGTASVDNCGECSCPVNPNDGRTANWETLYGSNVLCKNYNVLDVDCDGTCGLSTVNSVNNCDEGNGFGYHHSDGSCHLLKSNDDNNECTWTLEQIPYEATEIENMTIIYTWGYNNLHTDSQTHPVISTDENNWNLDSDKKRAKGYLLKGYDASSSSDQTTYLNGDIRVGNRILIQTNAANISAPASTTWATEGNYYVVTNGSQQFILRKLFDNLLSDFSSWYTSGSYFWDIQYPGIFEVIQTNEDIDSISNASNDADVDGAYTIKWISEDVVANHANDCAGDNNYSGRFNQSEDDCGKCGAAADYVAGTCFDCNDLAWYSGGFYHNEDDCSDCRLGTVDDYQTNNWNDSDLGCGCGAAAPEEWYYDLDGDGWGSSDDGTVKVCYELGDPLTENPAGG